MNITTSLLLNDKYLGRWQHGWAILIRLGLTIVLGVIGWLALEWLLIDQGQVNLPANLAGLPLSQQVNGQPALEEIDRLHNQPIPSLGATFASYGDGTARVWVAVTWASFLASQQVEDMTARIAEENTALAPIETRLVGDIPVYMLTGSEQKHYYFQLDRRVIWLSIPPQLAEQGLVELIDSLR